MLREIEGNCQLPVISRKMTSLVPGTPLAVRRWSMAISPGAMTNGQWLTAND
jgi:hypothetical protein